MRYDVKFGNIRFAHLKGTRYGMVYKSLVESKRLYSVDKEASCARLRKALEALLDELFVITGTLKMKQQSLLANLHILKEAIPEKLRIYEGEDIFIEMHNIRVHGNNGAHHNSRGTKDIDKATHASWIAAKKICGWVETFERNYDEYKNPRKKGTQPSKSKGMIGTIIHGCIIIAVLAAISILVVKYFKI